MKVGELTPRQPVETPRPENTSDESAVVSGATEAHNETKGALTIQPAPEPRRISEDDRQEFLQLDGQINALHFQLGHIDAEFMEIEDRKAELADAEARLHEKRTSLRNNLRATAKERALTRKRFEKRYGLTNGHVVNWSNGEITDPAAQAKPS